MAFQLSVTDTDTGTVHVAGYVRIDDAIVSLVNNSVELVLATYDSAAAAQAGLKPVVTPVHVTLTPAEVTALRGGFRAQLYVLLKARGLYTGALDV